MKKISTIALLAAASLSLAACSGGSDEEQPAAETNVANVAEPVEAANAAVETEAPSATRIDNVTAEAPPPVEALAADEQTQADAAATGMTARVDRSAPGNDSAEQPTQYSPHLRHAPSARNRGRRGTPHAAKARAGEASEPAPASCTNRSSSTDASSRRQRAIFASLAGDRCSR